MRRSVLYPPFIFTGMFLFVLVVYRSGFIDIDPLHANTMRIILLGATCFSIGGLLANLLPDVLLRTKIVTGLPKATPSPTFFRVMTLILLGGLPLFFLQVLQISRAGTGDNILMRARQAQLDATLAGIQVHSFIGDYFTTIATLSVFLIATGPRTRRLWIFVTIAFTSSILGTDRTSLLLLMSGLCAIMLIRHHRERFLQAAKFLRWPAVLFVALFTLLLFTNKSSEDLNGSAASPTQGATGIALYFAVSYIAGPLAAFDRVVQMPNDYTAMTSHVFAFLLKAASTLHLAPYTEAPVFDSFIFVPFPSNVYTIFKFDYLELGLAGMLAMMCLTGLLHSLVYLKAKQGSRFALFLFGYLLYNLLMVVFDDTYVIGGTVRAALFAGVYLFAESGPLRLFPRPHQRSLSAVNGAPSASGNNALQPTQFNPVPPNSPQ